VPAFAILAALLLAQQAARYEIVGRIEPPVRASVHVYGSTAPFNTSALADAAGRFRVGRLAPGTYTVSVFLPGRGEARQTIAVGPGTADKRNRVAVTMTLEDARLQRDTRHGTVSARELAIPDSARREYAEAQRLLGRPDVEGAIKRLERAVEIAPQFSAAWNNLGTIAYQTAEYPRAEEYFRRALEAEPGAYEPLVNLGGVLLNLQKFGEALEYNLHAVLMRANDALANSQLGLTYFELGRLELAEKYLRSAIKLDPGHFSHPQLPLADIYLRRGEPERAVEMLEHFLRRHPDAQGADGIRAAIAKLKAAKP
jgi:tetratricopeptide (TPR) repeat protein